MSRKIIDMLCVGVFLAVGLSLFGCASNDEAPAESRPYAILKMNNGATGFEPYIFKDGVATLLKDINAGAGDSNPYGYTSFNGKLYFGADDGTHGLELWVTDGTAAGTTLLKDIAPGVYGSNPHDFTVCNSKLYFVADDGTHGQELWVSDGTGDGTTLLKDINPGMNSSIPYSFIVFNDKLYFQAADGTHGHELWVSDGTVNGTTLLKDINPGPNGSDYSQPRIFVTVFNDNLYFQADDGIHGHELWVSDGTAEGTTLLKDINPGPVGSDPESVTPFNGKFYFTAYDATLSWGIWVSDGTVAGTILLKDPNTPFSNKPLSPYNFTPLNGKLYFNAYDSTYGQELWVSDGTGDGTTLLKDINPGVNGSHPYSSVFNDKLYSWADDGTHGQELWVSDGTGDGPILLKDINAGPDSSMFTVSLQYLAEMGLAYVSGDFKNYIFVSGDGGHGVELWSSDGTAAGTKIIMDFNPGIGNGVYSMQSAP